MDSAMIKNALAEFAINNLDILIIENVGNLVCPAEFYLGEDAKVMILAVTEGEDKPLKYPLMFRLSKALVINKVDLLPYIDCNIDRIIRDAVNLNSDLRIFEISCTKKTGLNPWKEWLEEEVNKKKNKSFANK